jgi:WD domain, G-beta repeat
LSPRKGRPQNTLRRASAGSDGTVRIWDRQTGEQHPTLEGHQDWVHGVCPVTVAGRELLASAGDNCTMRIWGPQTRRRHGLVATGVADSSESCGLGSLDRIGFGAPAAKAAVKASPAPVVSTARVPLARYRRVTPAAWMTQPDSSSVTAVAAACTVSGVTATSSSMWQTMEESPSSLTNRDRP